MKRSLNPRKKREGTPPQKTHGRTCGKKHPRGRGERCPPNFQERPPGGARSPPAKVRPRRGPGAGARPAAQPRRPAAARDPGRPARAPRLVRATPGRAGIDRRADKRIDFCAEKLIGLLLAPWTRERPASGAGDPAVLGGRAPGKPRDPQRPERRRAGPGPWCQPQPICPEPGRGGGRGAPKEGPRGRGGVGEQARAPGRERRAALLSTPTRGPRTQSPPLSRGRQTRPAQQPAFRKVAPQAAPHRVTALSEGTEGLSWGGLPAGWWTPTGQGLEC